MANTATSADEKITRTTIFKKKEHEKFFRGNFKMPVSGPILLCQLGGKIC